MPSARNTAKKSSGKSNGKAVRKKTSLIKVLAFLVFASLAAVVGLYFWNWYSDNKRPNFIREAVIFVRPESTEDEVYAQLINKAGVRRTYSLDHAFKDKQVAQYMQPGRYEIKPEYTSVYVARMLNNCWQTPAKLVLSGTMRQNSQIASKISSQLMIDSLDVINALSDKELLKKYGYTPQNVFSLFIPDTYEMWWTATMEDVFAKQKQANEAFWTDERKAKAKAQGLSPEQVSILASIVSGETNYEPEMPKIAGVYLNRLHKGMKLQADPTVAYCLNYEVNRILNKHLLIDSRYNTYRYPGLPPGPIAVPSKACLEAVLNPEGNYLFFCANSTFDGTHLFAVSYNDHLRNARAFQAALNARGK